MKAQEELYLIICVRVLAIIDCFAVCLVYNYFLFVHHRIFKEVKESIRESHLLEGPKYS